MIANVDSGTMRQGRRDERRDDEVQPSFQSLWWEMVKYSVRKAVDKKRNGASQAIKEEFMSKYSMQILEG